MKPLSFDDAYALILGHAAALAPQPTPLGAAFGRVLAADVVAPRDHPARDDSAMDGYAVVCSDLIGAARGSERRLPLAEAVAVPGLCATPTLPAGFAMRILTGGPLPHGADAVVRQEATRTEGGEIVFWMAPSVGDHVRRAGEDLAMGTTVLRAGMVLGVGEITALATIGIAAPHVYPQPTVALLVTGDELVAPGEPLGPGAIFDSNGPGLGAAIGEAGGELIPLGSAKDTAVAQRAALLAGLHADVLVTAGGISVGDRDHVASVLESLGTTWHVRGVRMKPGHPVSFGTRPRPGGQTQLVVGLPGNPAAALVAFEVFVRPALRRLCGHPQEARPREDAQLLAPLEKRGGTTYFVRGTSVRDARGLYFLPFDRQGAGMVTSMIGHDAVATLPADATALGAGAAVQVALHRVPPLRATPGAIVLAFVGPSGAGKTTLLEALLPRLRDVGIDALVLKHSHHPAPLGDEGKDTARLRAAGAAGVGLVSEAGAVLTQDILGAASLPAALCDATRMNSALSAAFPRAALVLLEGFHDAVCPKILVLGDGGAEPRDLALKDVLAVIGGPPGGLDGDGLRDAPRIPRNGVADLAGLVITYLRRRALGDRVQTKRDTTQ